MYDLINERISSLHRMQLDLLGDGEPVVPFSECKYYAEMYENCEELPHALAMPMALELFKHADEYAVANGLYIARCSDAPCTGYAKIEIIDKQDGAVCATLCYNSNDANSYYIVFKGLWEVYKEHIIFI